MQDSNDKNTGSTFSASEWNQIPAELQNVITSSGQTLSGADVEQVVKALAHYAANGTFYVDSGIADAYTLNTIGGNIVAPTYHNGREVEFIVTNTNTGSSTVNVNTVGLKSITGSDAPGALTEGVLVRLRFDSTADAFTIVGTSDLIAGIFAGDYLASRDPNILTRGFTAVDIDPVDFGDPGANLGAFSALDFFGGSGVTAHSLTGVAVNAISGEVWVADTASGDGVFRAARGSTVWVETSDDYATGAASPVGIAVDQGNDDVFVLDGFNKAVRKLTGGVGVWAIIGGTYVGNTPIYIAVNSNTKDVWTVDGDIFSGGSGPGLAQLAGGTGSWAAFPFPGTVPIAIAVNQNNGDVWVVDSSEAAVYKLANSVGAFSTSGVGSFPGTAPVAIAVNSKTGAIWIEDSASGLFFSADGVDNWVLVNAHGNDFNYLAIDDDTGRLYGSVADLASEDVLFDAPGTTVNWHVKT